MSSRLSSETIHASAVAIGGRAVLIGGRSGQGKSDLALRLIDRGAVLVGDDYVLVRRSGSSLIAAAHATIAGRIEVRGLGLLEMAAGGDAPVALLVDLDARVERHPEPGETRMLAGVEIPVVRLNALEASAPLKVELALERFGLSG